ncbi:MAG: hypothetical protein M3Y32_02325 [Pseudomonadota bacterium]|nr:hypothetical protein [Pseudomonadota bacterium]
MNPQMPRLRNEIVMLEILEAHKVEMDATEYRTAARNVRHIVEHHWGALAMEQFVCSTVPALQTIAENVYFDHHRRFADLDGSRHALQAQAIADQLLHTLCRASRD